MSSVVVNDTYLDVVQQRRIGEEEPGLRLFAFLAICCAVLDILSFSKTERESVCFGSTTFFAGRSRMPGVA